MILHEQLELYFGGELDSLRDQARRMLKSLLYNGSATRGQQWFSKAGRMNAVNNEGGWDQMISNALLRVIEEDDFSRGMRAYANYLASEYGDTRERTSEWWSSVIEFDGGIGGDPLSLALVEDSLQRETSSTSPSISVEVSDDTIVVRQDLPSATSMRTLATAIGAALAQAAAASTSSAHNVRDSGVVQPLSDLLVLDEERVLFESLISTRNLAETARFMNIPYAHAKNVVQRVRRRADRLAA